MSEVVGQSKSAARRARAKAVAATKAAEEVPEPTAKPNDEPKAKAKGKAKAEPKAEPKAAPKAKAEPKAAPKAEPTPSEPKAKPAAKSDGKKKAPKAAKKQDDNEEQEQSQPKQRAYDGPPMVLDDGAGGEWEEVSGLTKKAASRKARMEEEKELERQARAAAGGAKVKEGQVIPGMNYAPEPTAKAKAEGGPKEKAGPKLTAAEALAAAPPPEKAKESDNTTVTVHVPEGKIGRIIGPKGSNLKLITEKTGVNKIDTEDTQIVIMGSAQSVNLAELAVKELIEKGYMSLAFEDFKEESVMAHPTVFPDLIGKQGAVIRKIKEALNVEVGIPQVPKNAPPGKKFKVTLAGSCAQCDKAKACIENIVMYGHDEITHPGMVHVEMTEIQEWQYKFLIGTKGSEMRHICNSFHVKMSIPREHSENRNVVIVGEARDVERAKAYAEKVIYQAEQPRGGRGSDGPAIDDGGGDDEMEDWMSPYMYKRR